MLIIPVMTRFTSLDRLVREVWRESGASVPVLLTSDLRLSVIIKPNFMVQGFILFIYHLTVFLTAGAANSHVDLKVL